MAKKTNIKVRIDFDGDAIILDESSYPAVDDYIKRGQMPLCVSYQNIPHSGVTSYGNIYPNKFDGVLTFTRVANKISVSAHGEYIWEWYGQDDFALPAKVLISNVHDKNVTSHYFNKEEEDIDSGTVIEAPLPKAPAKKTKA